MRPVASRVNCTEKWPVRKSSVGERTSLVAGEDYQQIGNQQAAQVGPDLSTFCMIAVLQ